MSPAHEPRHPCSHLHAHSLGLGPNPIRLGIQSRGRGASYLPSPCGFAHTPFGTGGTAVEIETLRLFHEVISRSSITDAARRCFMSQQALSRKIASLEDEVGHQLINRTTPLTLTPAGKVFLRESNDIVNAYEHMMRALDGLSSQAPDQIRIRDYGTGSFTSIFAGILDRVSMEHPEIDVRFVRVNEDDVYLIESGAIDIGFVRTISVDGKEYLEKLPHLTYLRLTSDTSPLVFGARANHPLLSIERPTLRDVARFRLAMPSDTDKGAFPLAVKRLFADLGITLEMESVYCNSSTEHFFEYFSGMSPDSVSFFTEHSYRDYMSGFWLKDCHHEMVRPTGADYQTVAYAIYQTCDDRAALAAVVDMIRQLDATMAR